MSIPPTNYHDRNNDTKWSWDGVPQVKQSDPGTTSASDQVPATYQSPDAALTANYQATPSNSQSTGFQSAAPHRTGYTPVEVRPQDFSNIGPGIIPLRPLKLGEFFDGGFAAIRYNPTVMMGMAGIVIISILAIELFFAYLIGRHSLDTFYLGTIPAATITDSEIITYFTQAIIPMLFSFIGTTVLTGLLINCVTQAVIGSKPSLSQIWEKSKGQILRLLGLTFLVWSFVITIIALATTLLLVLAGLVLLGIYGTYNQNNNDIVTAVVLVITFVGIIFCILWAVVKTSLATAILMSEESGVFTSFTRSFRLSRGSFWRLFGVETLTTVLIAIMAGLVIGIASAAAGAGLTVSGVVEDPIELAFWIVLISTILQSLSQLVFTPLWSAVVTLLYIDTRMRKEGLDLVLQRAVADTANAR